MVFYQGNLLMKRLVIFFSVTFSLFVAVIPAMTMAQDTQLYIGATGSGGINHNLLFILDTSGSMRNFVPNSGDMLPDGTRGPDKSRIAILKEVMDSTIAGLNNMNVGYMRMNGAFSAGSTLPRTTALDCRQSTLDNLSTSFPNVSAQRVMDIEAGTEELIKVNAQTHGAVDGRTAPNIDNACYIPTGGNILFPVRNLDTQVAELPFTAQSIDITSISTSAGDAQQLVGGTISLDSPTLDIGSSQCSTIQVASSNVTSGNDDAREEVRATFSVFNSSSNTIAIGQRSGFGELFSAFRFRNLGIPADVIISEASLVFTTDPASSTSTGLNVPIQAVLPGDGVAFPADASVSSAIISNQTLTSAAAFWQVPIASGLSAITSVDVGSVVEEWLNDRNTRVGTTTGTVTEPITFIIGPRLGGGLHAGREIRTANHSSGGTTLNLTYCQRLATATKVNVGLNFQDVNIPQGSTIDSAFIEFLPAPTLRPASQEDNSEKVTITAHAADDSAVFTATSNIAALPTTAASVDWTVAQMGTWLRTPVPTVDLSNIVQEIVGRNGWCGGNSMSFIIAGQDDLWRRVNSFDSDSGSPPVLHVAYTNGNAAGSTGGCDARSIAVALAQVDHSSLQLGAGQTANAIENTLSIESGSIMGMIFALPIGATGVGEDINITRAELEFYIESSTTSVTGGPDILINVEDSVDALNFLTGVGRLDATIRPRLASAGTVELKGNNLRTSASVNRVAVDVTSLVSAVTEQTGWQADNKIAFLLEADTSSTDSHSVLNFRTGVATNQQPKLNIEYQQTGASTATVRDALLTINELLQNANLLSWTPSVETLFEAALYWRGKEMVFGRFRGAARLGTQHVIVDTGNDAKSSGNISEDIDFTFAMHRTTTSHPGSWEGGVYNESPDKTGTRSCQYRRDPECARDSISDDMANNTTAQYISPIATAEDCARNFQIFLTDGQPTLVNKSTENMIIAEFGGVTSCSVNTAINAQLEKGRCAVEMVTDMANADQNPVITGTQTIQTYTVAFNLTPPPPDPSGSAPTEPPTETWLKQLANAGGGAYYEATDANALQAVFNEIIGEILQAPRAFSPPSISANAFNRLFSRDETYFGLFEAQRTPRWDGNLKKYRICTDSNNCILGDIIDSRGVALFRDQDGNATDQFNNNARSVWGNVDDGRDLRLGGAGASLLEPSDRTIYTQFDNDLEKFVGSLNSTGRVVNTDTWAANFSALSHIHASVCPGIAETANLADLQAGEDSCEDRMFWMLGADVRDTDSDGDTTELRPWWFPDILHSSPVVVTYGTDINNKFIDKILVGTNGGGVHMIDGEDGDEDWVFIPHELFANQPILYRNVVSDNVYGMDLTPVIRMIDVNRDATIDPADNDKVFGYFGMRRGGNSYYALDLTPAAIMTNTETRIVPSFVWSITTGGTSSDNANNFSRLGQTWSEPVVARIRCTGCVESSRTVLIFGGGYDAGLDDNFGLIAGRPNRGNAIYIVDADTGKIVLWIGHAAVLASGTLPAIPASGADIEVKDMLYSIVVKPTVLDSDGDGFMDRVYVGDLAGQVWRVDLAADGENAVVGKLADISDSEVLADQRRFHYAPAVVQVKDETYSTNSEYDYIVIASGDRASPLATTAQDRLYAFRDYQITPMDGDADGVATNYPVGNSGAIKESDLIDVTARVLSGAEDSDLEDIRDSQGWFFSFTADGQKGLSSPVVLRGELFLTSYLPPGTGSASSLSCSAAEGSGVAHNFNLLTAAATQNWDGDGAIDPVNNRSSALGGGIPSSVIPIFTEGGVTLSVGTGQGPKNLGSISSVPRARSYWTEDAPTF